MRRRKRYVMRGDYEGVRSGGILTWLGLEECHATRL